MPIATTTAGVERLHDDLSRKVGYTAARLAETRALDPAPLVASLELSCAELPGSVECLQTLADIQDLAGQHQTALDTLDRTTPQDRTTSTPC